MATIKVIIVSACEWLTKELKFTNENTLIFLRFVHHTLTVVVFYCGPKFFLKFMKLVDINICKVNW